ADRRRRAPEALARGRNGEGSVGLGYRLEGGKAGRAGTRATGAESPGHIGIKARSADDWAKFGTKFLGMQLVDRTSSTLTFRMDDRRQRVVIHADGGEGAAFFGW